MGPGNSDFCHGKCHGKCHGNVMEMSWKSHGILFLKNCMNPELMRITSWTLDSVLLWNSFTGKISM